MTGLITAAQQVLEALIENARLLGWMQAKKAFGCYSQEDANLERAWHEGIAKHSDTIRLALAQQAEPGAWGRRREMNKENIIRMAREACETTNWKPGLGNEHVVEFMTRFAAIAAAAGADAALEAEHMTNLELLENAAKAAGFEWVDGHESVGLRNSQGICWNPLTNDADAFRLMVKLRLQPRQGINLVSVLHPDFKRNDENYRDHNNDPLAATRRAIVRAAAEIGRSMA